MRRLLCVFAALLAFVFACGSASAEEPTGSMELQYADHFSVDYYAGGAALLRAGEQAFLLLSDGASVPEGLEKLPRISVPVRNIYLASSSVPDLFLQMEILDGTLMSQWLVRVLLRCVRICCRGLCAMRYNESTLRGFSGSGMARDLVFSGMVGGDTPVGRGRLDFAIRCVCSGVVDALSMRLHLSWLTIMRPTVRSI